MILYHFTSVNFAESILHSSLSRGHLNTGSGDMLQGVVWLTSSPSPEGHGLLTGKETLTDRQAAYVARVQRQATLRNRATTNKTLVRFAIDGTRLTERLIKFTEWASLNRMPSLYTKIMGLSAHYDMSTLSDKDLLRALKHTPTQEQTWYLHFGSIDPVHFQEVSYATSEGYVPYAFEDHGRFEAAREGLIYLGADTLETLRAIVPADGSTQPPRAHVFVAHPQDPVRCIIRCRQFMALFTVSDACILVEKTGDLAPLLEEALKAWLLRHRPEVEHCHEQALEAYYRYYPTAAPKHA